MFAVLSKLFEHFGIALPDGSDFLLQGLPVFQLRHNQIIALPAVALKSRPG